MNARDTLDSSTPPPLAAVPPLAERVIQWQRAHGRHGLPWQGTRDPYRVWLSEVMLQQTQVSTVLAYYDRFLARFPDVASLAAAPLDDVLAMWSGLGYYSRARNLHRCAQAVVSQHAGRFPASAEVLSTLPGIGRSTAAAIAAFCFGERAAILDGNVKRVLARVLAFGGDLAQVRHQRTLWAHADALLPDQGIEAYTQGLMDIGAQICAVRSPRCVDCPLADPCLAHGRQQTHLYPVKSRRRPRKRRVSDLLWLTRGELLWLTQRPARGVWAGLWCFPEWAHDDAVALRDRLQSWPGSGVELSSFDHALTHFEWTLRPLRWTLPARLSASQQRRLCATLGEGRWCTLSEALGLGLPAPVRRLLLEAEPA